MKLRTLTTIAVLLVLSACGKKEEPADAAPAVANESTPSQAPSAPESTPQATTANPQQRVGQSASTLLTTKPPVLGSYHLEMSGSGPTWDNESNSAKDQKYTVKGDVEADNLHVLRTVSTAGGADESFEGYMVKGGMGNAEGGGKEFEVKDGKLQPAFGVELVWAFLPMELLGPVAVGGAGAKLTGTETIAGRKAEKYDINSDNAPAGVMAMLGGGMEKLRGTAWVDAETGALLKLVADYDQTVLKPGTKETAAKGARHVELEVSGIGGTKVTLPE